MSVGNVEGWGKAATENDVYGDHSSETLHRPRRGGEHACDKNGGAGGSLV